MSNHTHQKFLSVHIFTLALAGVTAAFGSVAIGSVLADNPRNSQAASQVFALVSCVTLSGTCLTLAAGAAVDE